MKIDEDWRQRQCSILFPSVPSPVKWKILTQYFPNPSSSPLFPSPLFPWSGRRLTPETVFVIVPYCPFCCEAKIRSPSPKSFVPSSFHCFGLQEVLVCRKHNSAGNLFLKSWFFNGNCLLKKLCNCHFGFWVLIWRFCIRFMDQFCFLFISCGALFVVNLPFKLVVFSLHFVDKFSW
jgi:hypothetical protein